MKSVIIGGSGFVGGYLAEHLCSLGHEVVITGMPQPQAGMKAVKSGTAGSRIAVYDLDILEKEAVWQLLSETKPDFVFHLAAQSSVAVSWKNPQLTIDVNIKGSTNVLEAMLRLEKKPNILLIGSGEEYGSVSQEEVPVKETKAAVPGNIYAATKACQNRIGCIYAQAYGLRAVMVRAFNQIGPKQHPMYVAADFCRQAALIEAGKREAVIRTGNLEARRDFTDVRDTVRAYALLAEKGCQGETYNVGSGKAASIREILQIVLDNSYVNIRVEVDEKKLRPTDTPVMEADISKLQSLTGWKPQISLEQTIQEMLDDWRRRVGLCKGQADAEGKL
ncbi:MAG: GDP-mannose 4,6-dehydratase [Eubacterium sp.]|nr:GDP-mannose 4,6-dehydratase [Eubacterium sp.]